MFVQLKETTLNFPFSGRTPFTTAAPVKGGADHFGEVSKMMNLWRTTHAELFAEHFLLLLPEQEPASLCKWGHRTLSAAVLALPAAATSKKPLCKLLPVFWAGTEAAQGIWWSPHPWKCSKKLWMWHLRTWFSGEHDWWLH